MEVIQGARHGHTFYAPACVKLPLRPKGFSKIVFLNCAEKKSSLEIKMNLKILQVASA